MNDVELAIVAHVNLGHVVSGGYGGGTWTCSCGEVFD